MTAFIWMRPGDMFGPGVQIGGPADRSRHSVDLGAPPVCVSPDMAMMRPSPSVMAEAYQRPSTMFCDCTKPADVGSKMEARLSPVNDPYFDVPPTMSARPSGRVAVPLQNTS